MWVESEGKEGKRANLREANLQEARLYEANLQDAYLYGANLQKATLIGAKLQKATLIEANLQDANLGSANLQGADLRFANLQGVNFKWADLQGANLVLARGLSSSQFRDAENWELAFYSEGLLKELGLPPDHNERVRKKLAEMEKEKKATGGKP